MTYAPGMHINGDQTEQPLSNDAPTKDFLLNHICIRTCDPKASLHFWVDLMGMRTVFITNAGPMTVYYLGHPRTPEHRADPVLFGKETQKNLATTPGLLELVYINDSTAQVPESGKPISFGVGHIGITMPEVGATVERLRKEGVEIVKELGTLDTGLYPTKEGEQGAETPGLTEGFKFIARKIAFVKDPVGYEDDPLTFPYAPLPLALD
jgi:lactoylglutathione lyase